MSLRKPLLMVFLLLPLAQGVAAESLDRLFFTPEKRVQLERQRQYNIQEAQSLEGATMRLDGVVVRSSGKRTVWVNSRAQHDKAAPAGVAVDVSRRDPGQAVLTAGEETPAPLKVGESINRATRDKMDALGGGRVGVTRTRPPKTP